MTLAKRLSGAWTRGDQVADFRQPFLPISHADERDQGASPAELRFADDEGTEDCIMPLRWTLMPGYSRTSSTLIAQCGITDPWEAAFVVSTSGYNPTDCAARLGGPVHPTARMLLSGSDH